MSTTAEADAQAAGSVTTTETTATTESTETTETAQGRTARDRRALRELLAPVATATRIAMGLQVLGSLATLVPFIAIAELATTLLSGPPVDEGRVWWIVWFVLAGLGARALLGGVALAITHFADNTLQALIRRRMVDRLGRVPLGWFTANSSGLVRKSAQNDIQDLHYLVAHQAVETTAVAVLPVAGLGYLCWVDWRLALLAVATFPIYLLAYLWMTRGMTERMERMNAAFADLSAAIVEFVSGIAVVKAFGTAHRAHRRYRRAAAGFGEFYADWVGPMLRVEALCSMSLSAPVVALVSLSGGTWFVSRGWVSPVDVLVEVLIAMTIPSALVTFSFGMQARRQAAAAAGRITDLLATPVLPVADAPEVPDGHRVSFHDVRFSYDGSTEVLRGVDLDCAPGTVTALVGASGSGKSTLATLLPRFHDVTGGAVRIGGADVRRIDPAELYRRVGFVLQDVRLLHGSVADNLRLGRPEATDGELRDAARAARIHERIEALPRGYDSVVGADAALSGGEAQRVCIARALLADTPVLVLDEATAFTDPESEAAIQDALSTLAGGRTVLVIAHRLASIVGADQIAVLAGGRVAERGRHDELVAAGGHYARMWRSHADSEPGPGGPEGEVPR